MGNNIALLSILCLLLLLPFQHLYGLEPNRHVSREKCAVCEKTMQNYPYKGNHPKCQTCEKVKEQCPYKGNHPAPKAAGYDVTFSCNVPDAALFIDGNQNGTASGTRFLKTGKHLVK